MQKSDHFIFNNANTAPTSQRLWCGDNNGNTRKTTLIIVDLQCHSWAPLNLDTAELPPEEHVVKLQKHGSDIGVGVQRLPGLVHDGQRPLGPGSRLPVGNNVAATSGYLHFPFLAALPEAVILWWE